MKPLICPQCGGRITDYQVNADFATCGYCGTKFLIEHAAPEMLPLPVPQYDIPETPAFNPVPFLAVIVVVGILFSIFVVAAILVSKSKTTTFYPTPASRTPVPAATPNPNLLGFGGKGEANGSFNEAKEITVDAKGKIYVADKTLRVQQFSPDGTFLKIWQIPAKGANYERAHLINKIAVADNGNLYVAVGGVILIYKGDSTTPSQTIQVAPDYIQDFVLRKDGSLLFISDNDHIETLVFANSAGKFTRRIEGFHTDAANTVISPAQTALATIRLAIDGAGNIFSVYAFGILGGYMVSYNPQELMILRFTPEGKFVNKLAQSLASCGIALDNQNRIYVSNTDSINIYSNNGDQISTVNDLKGINSFALDNQNNIYFVSDDKVFKRPAV